MANENSIFLSVGNRMETGALTSINLSDGTRKWSYHLNSFAHHSPVVFDRFVAIGDRSGTLHIVHASNGQKAWTFETGNPITVSPLVYDGLIFVIGTNGVYCLDAWSGEEQWHTDTGNSFNSSASISETHGIIVVMGSNKNDSSELFIYLVEIRSGKVRLKYPVTSFLPSIPTISGTTVVINSEQHTVIAIDLMSKDNSYLRVLNFWRRQAFMLGFADSFPMPLGYKWHMFVGGSIYDSILADNEKFYLIRKYPIDRIDAIPDIYPTGYLTAIDPKDGSITWNLTEGALVGGIGTLNEDGIILASKEGTITYVDKLSGNIVWHIETSLEISETPIGSGDKIIVASEDNKIYLFQ
jgi:outer membrane protein assembly factor BamB